MTPAVDLLNKLAMAYKLHEYEHDARHRLMVWRQQRS
jgi:hypothetical protein